MPEGEMLAMFMLGLLGTGHCLGMCGPLVFALPGQSGRWSCHLFYHVGRITTYTVIGLLVGALGSGLTAAVGGPRGDAPFTLVGVQIFVSAMAALFLLFLGLSRLGIIAEPGWLSPSLIDHLPGSWKRLKTAVQGRQPLAMLMAGLLLGLLPCGLSYAAFARVLPIANPVYSAGLLLCFGLGTLPGLLLLGTGAGMLIRRYQRYSEVASGVLMIYMALDLIIAALCSLGG
jgi:sulfite exporter TauE/SafE